MVRVYNVAVRFASQTSLTSLGRTKDIGGCGRIIHPPRALESAFPTVERREIIRLTVRDDGYAKGFLDRPIEIRFINGKVYTPDIQGS